MSYMSQPSLIADPVTGAMREEPKMLPNPDPSTSGVLEFDLDEFLNWMSDLAVFAYDGFDPKTWREFFIKHLRSKLKSDGEVKEVIANCLKIVAMRGVKINMANPKAKAEAVKILQQLQGLGVSLNPKARAPGSNVITLQRVAACFPRELSAILATGSGRIVGAVPASLPAYFAHPHSLAIMSEAEMQTHYKAYVEWRMNFSRIITSGRQSDEELLTNVQKFNDIIYKSTLYSEDERIKICASLKRINQQKSTSSSMSMSEYPPLASTAQKSFSSATR